jgi:hypothetical protein
VGCTEAFNVIDEFVNLPREERADAALGYVDLPSGWSCTVDDGETANVTCGKDEEGTGYGLTLHTITDGQAGDDVDPVDCGEVDVNDTVHHLIADSAPKGRVGCTEAFNVIDEFVILPREERADAALGYVHLPSGWSCTVDDGETANVTCGKDEEGTEYGLTLHTEQQVS